MHKSYIITISYFILVFACKDTQCYFNSYYVYYMDGSRGPPYYFAATGKRFLSKGHVNYLIIAFVMGFVFNILPRLLLCLKK